jgi:uncharacterized protein (TIGR01244 family)
MARVIRSIACISFLIGYTIGCASASKSGDEEPMTPPSPAARIETDAGGAEFNNLYHDGERYFAGQPTENGLRDLADRGVKTVINLRPADEMAARVEFDEPALVAELDMRYVSLPVTGATYSLETVDELDRILKETDGQVLLHCGSANRVGLLWANYLARHRGVDLEEAIDLGRAAGMTQESLFDRVRQLAETADAESH